MPNTKQEIKRCSVCNRFISPKSETNFCKTHSVEDRLGPFKTHGELSTKEPKEYIKFNPGPLVIGFGEPLAPGEVRDGLRFDNDKVYCRIGQDNFIDIGEFKDGVFVPNVHLPSADDVDFKTEFVYESITPDKLRAEILPGIKMDFGAKTHYKVYMKRVDE